MVNVRHACIQFLPAVSGLRLIGVFVEVAEALIGVLEFEVEASIFLHSPCILPFCTAISQALNKAFSKTKNKKKRSTNQNLKSLSFVKSLKMS